MKKPKGTRVLFVQPWNYHDEGVQQFDHDNAWRNGPYNLILLATLLNNAGHTAVISDLSRKLIGNAGDVERTLHDFGNDISTFKPDIIAISFFSIHYFEVKRIVGEARQVCAKVNISPMFVGGGIHPTVAPETCLDDLGFDYAFVGEGDIGILKLADGARPATVFGAIGKSNRLFANGNKGEQVQDLNDLAFPDWSLVDYKFYSHPSYARLGFEKVGSLDLIMGRGCVYDCSFCAYQVLSAVRFYTADYLFEQMLYMMKSFDVRAFYFTDSTIGNNRKVLRELCELIIRKGFGRKIVWLANIRPNQINEEQLRLMWRAGCRYLLYGFESNSQRMLDLMSKKCTVQDNETCAALHNKLMFPYNASMLFGYPGEREDDLLQTIEFIKRFNPPSVGINWYVPLPGSPDYDKLKADGVINTDNPEEWRLIGQVNEARCYADMEYARFRELYDLACLHAYSEIPKTVYPVWAEHHKKGTTLKNLYSVRTVFKNVYSHIPRLLGMSPARS